MTSSKAEAYLYTAGGIQIIVTGTGATASEAVKDLLAAQRNHKLRYHNGTPPKPIIIPPETFHQPGTDPEDANNPYPKATPPLGLHTAPVPATAPGDPKPDKRGNSPGEKKAEKIGAIEITPLADDKTKIAFFPFMRNGKAGRYPLLLETKDSAEWGVILSEPLPGLNLAVAGKYDCRLKVQYEIGSNKTKNGYYYLNYRQMRALNANE